MPAPAVFTIPPHRAFADALVAGLIARAGERPEALAEGLILLPNNRAVRAITDAFVRRADRGLLLPRLVAIGDEGLDARAGALLDPLGADPLPPAIDPLARQLLLARLVQRERSERGTPIDAAEAARLAADLARTLDELAAEGIAPAELREAVDPDMSEHWQASLAVLETVLARYPEALAARGLIDPGERRARLLARLGERWSREPPATLVVAAGIGLPAPAAAGLLRAIAFAPAGMVVLPGLDTAMGDTEWTALGPHAPTGDGTPPSPPIETHPQYELKLLLERMGIARGEVRRWRFGGGRDAPAVRTRAINNALVPAAFTARWQTLPNVERRLSGIQAAEFATPAEEAEAIAIAIRERLERAGETVALVTPDRGLARRVVAHLGRWGIAADDSAGRPLSATPPGALLLLAAEAAAEGFAPVALLSLLKHPLVRTDARAEWLEGARRLDVALRGPRPASGLDGIARHLREGTGRDAAVRRRALPFWDAAAPLLAPLEAAFADVDARADRLPRLVAALRAGVDALCGPAAWAGVAGRAAADLTADLELAAADGPVVDRVDTVSLLLRGLCDAVAVRPAQGGHPRVAIWGLLEARLQQADLMILGGLNEGVWPSALAPDPWLSPRIRRTLALPGLERRIGRQAHALAEALGGRQVLVTRARRDARAPTIASRFWLRMTAMTGGLTQAPRLVAWARSIDRPGGLPAYAPRPAPRPRVADRPREIAVTALDRLKADPYSFYAGTMLRLSAWDAIDAEPSPAWRGTAVHAVFEAWMKEAACDPARLEPLARAMLDSFAAHPVTRALWAPRLLEAIGWTAARMAEHRAAGREPLVAELAGRATIAGVTVKGKVDRIDRLPGGDLAIVDYKTGTPPSRAQVSEGYAMQLGLLGLIAEHGGFEGVAGTPAAFEYWSLARNRRTSGFGFDEQAVADADAPDFTTRAARNLIAAVERWLTGDDAFTARLVPDYAPYGDYDQLMRLDEWYGRADG